MPTQNTVWIVIACDEVTDKLRGWLDNGHFEDAVKYAQLIHDFCDKIQKFAQEKGGHLYVSLYDRQIMELPASAADQLPYIIEGYKEDLGRDKIAVGIGLDYMEAARAAQHSRTTGEIELFTPGETPTYKAEDPIGASGDLKLDTDVSLPPNIFDPQLPPKMVEKVTPKEPHFTSRPEMDKEIAAETKMLQAIGQQMQPPTPPAPPPGQPGGSAQPQDLMEALHGGPVPGHQPQQAEAEGKPEEGEKEGEFPDEEAGAEKLYGALANIQQKIPQLMELHDKNPEAFKRSMDLINKLMKLTQTKKSEKLSLKLEELKKAFAAGTKRNWPVGTTINRRKKVLVDGKSVWRSIISGQVRDDHGQIISVKSSNKQSLGAPLTAKDEKHTSTPAKHWQVKVKGNPNWYPMTRMEDRGEQGNFYHLEGVGPVHQSQIEDVHIPGEKPVTQK